MNKLFGTDGIRGIANEYPMTTEVALNVGRAIVSFQKKRTYPSNNYRQRHKTLRRYV